MAERQEQLCSRAAASPGTLPFEASRRLNSCARTHASTGLTAFLTTSLRTQSVRARGCGR